MNTLKQNYRSPFIDVLRGFTVVLMIIFHFSFDLDYFGFINIDIVKHPFWYFFPRLIVFLFLFVTGMALTLTHQNGLKVRAFSKRLLLIVFWAAMVSLVTYFLFPDSWIYFGTLHAIAVISCIVLPFINRPILAFIVGLALFIASTIFDKTLPWFQLPHLSWDYISPFPWMGASLFGIFAVHNGLQNTPLKDSPMTRFLTFLGKHSLFVYLIHQPILFGLISLIVKLKHS